MTVGIGDWAVFTVAASGAGLSYQWQYYNAYTKAWTDIGGATYATMYFRAQAAYNGVWYHCVVTDGTGASVTSNYVKLTVNASLAITSQPRDVYVGAGDWAVFTVGAAGSNLSYRWQYYSTAYKTWLDIAGATYATMYFTAKTGYSGIYYHCVVTDGSGASVTSNYVKLTVNGTLVITSQPQYVTVEAGQWAVFTVGATGDGLSYQWQYYNAYYKAWINIAGATYATMYFTAQESYNGIYYRCIVTDGGGDWVVSSYARLSIVSQEPTTPEEILHRYDLYYATRYENGEEITLLLKKYNGSFKYTEVLCECNGLEVISQKSTDSGEDFILKLSPDLSQGHAAVLTLNIMDGDEVYQSLVLYAAATERGTYVNEGGTRGLWGNYYYDRYNDGEFEYYDYDKIVYVINTSSDPSLEDPVPTHPRTSYLFD